MKKILLSLTLACFGLTANSYAQTIVSQNFESGFAPWTVATTGGGGGWAITSGITPTQLGSFLAHTNYAVVNEGLLGASQYNDPTIMTSPAFSLSGYANPYLSFDWNYFQAYLSAAPHTHELAWIQISTDGGATYTLLDSIVATTTGDWDTRFISLSGYSSATCKLQFCYSDQGAQIIGIAVDNITVFNAQANDISMVSVTPAAGDPGADFGASGTAFTFGGVVRNLSPTTMTSFTASYSVAGGAAVATPITGASIAPMATYTFTCTTPYTDVTMGNQPVQIFATVAGDPVLTNDTLLSAANVYTTLPVKTLMYEEGTGMWCGYCVRGIVFMDSLEKNDSLGVNIVAVHDQLNGTDGIAAENTFTSDYDKFVSYFPGFTGYPGVLVDRRYVIDPSDAFTAYDDLNGYFGYANVTSAFTIASGKINVSATVTPGIAMNGDYRLALVISEDYVHKTSFYQHDYYSNDNSGGSVGPLYGMGYNFQDSVFSIPGSSLYFKFCARYTVPDMYTTPGGIASSLPATMAAGTAYPYTFAPVTIPADWNPNYLRATVLLIDNNPGNTNMQILNSSGHVSPTYPIHTAGVSNVAAGIEGLNIFPNPAKDQAHATFNLKETGLVHFAIYDALGREVFSVPAETMQQGGQQINFSTSNLPSGVYNVSITTSNGTETQGLSVVR